MKHQSLIVLTSLYSLLTACGSESGSCCGSSPTFDLRSSSQTFRKEASTNVDTTRFPINAQISASVSGSTFSLGTIGASFENKTYEKTISLRDVNLSLLKESLRIKVIGSAQAVFSQSSNGSISVYKWSPNSNQLAFGDAEGDHILSLSQNAEGETIVTSTPVEGSPLWLADGRLLTKKSISDYDDLQFTVRASDLQVEKKFNIKRETIRSWSENATALYRITITTLNASGSVTQSTSFDSETAYGVNNFCVGDDGATIYGDGKSIDTATGNINASEAHCTEGHGFIRHSFDSSSTAEKISGDAKWSGTLSLSVTSDGLESETLNSSECHTTYAVGEVEIKYNLQLTSEFGDTILQEGVADWNQSNARCVADHCG